MNRKRPLAASGASGDAERAPLAVTCAARLNCEHPLHPVEGLPVVLEEVDQEVIHLSLVQIASKLQEGDDGKRQEERPEDVMIVHIACRRQHAKKG